MLTMLCDYFQHLPLDSGPFYVGSVFGACVTFFRFCVVVVTLDYLT